MKIHCVYLSGVLVKSSMSIPIARAERRHLTVPHVNVRPGTRMFLSITTMSCGCGGGGGEEALPHHGVLVRPEDDFQIISRCDTTVMAPERY